MLLAGTAIGRRDIVISLMPNVSHMSFLRKVFFKRYEM